MSTPPTEASSLHSEEKMLEAWRLHSLGFACAAAASARTSIELAIRERSGHLGRYSRRRLPSELLTRLANYGVISGKQRKRFDRLFKTLCGYVSGRIDEEEPVYQLLVWADAARHQIAGSRR